MSPSPILSPSDEEVERLLTQPDAEADEAEAIDSDEEKERLLTQPDAEADKAEAIDLTVESEAPNTKRLGPSKRKVITITPLESSRSNEIGCRRRLLLLSCIAEKIGSFCTSTMGRLLRRGCIMMTIILLKNTRLFCLHLNMKRMLNQKSMWEWMRTKSGEKYGDVFRVLYTLSLSQTIKEEFLPTHFIPTGIPKAQQI